MQHNTFSHKTRYQLRQFVEALLELTALPEAALQKSIGFVHQKDSKGLVKQAGSQIGFARLGYSPAPALRRQCGHDRSPAPIQHRYCGATTRL